MKKFTKHGKVIAFIVLLIWVALNIVIVTCVGPEYKTLKIIVTVITSSITTCIVRPFLSDVINAVNNIFKITEPNEDKNGKETTQKWFFIVLYFLIVVGFVLMSVNENKKDDIEVSTVPGGASNTVLAGTLESEIISTTIIYDFSNPSEEFDIYFKNADGRSLLECLDASLSLIPFVQSVSDEELKIADRYGVCSCKAVSHEKELIRLLDDPDLKNGPLPQIAVNFIIQQRLLMENEYQTPANRKLIADAYLNRVIYKLGDNLIEDAENAVRYTWGRIYMEIAWDNFKSESIDDLIEMYGYLRNVNSREEKRINEVINALERLKIRAGEHAFSPEDIK